MRLTEPYQCPEGCTTMPCGNYAGAMEDCDQAVKQMIRLLRGETTPERTRTWVRLNYPKLANLLDAATADPTPQMLDALRECADYEGRSPFLWRRASMRKLAALGFVTEHGRKSGPSEFRLTDLGRRTLENGG